MQDRQHSAVPRRVEKLVRVPSRCERPGFSLTVSDHTNRDEIRIVEDGAVGMRDRIAKLTAFMDRARRLRRAMARDSTRKRELAEQALHSALVLGDVGIYLAVGTFEIGVCDDARAAMAWPGDENRIQVALPDHTVHMRVNEIEPGRRTPVAQEPRLDVFQPKRLAQEGIVQEIDLPDRKIIRCAPIGIELAKVFGRQRPRLFDFRCHRSFSLHLCGGIIQRLFRRPAHEPAERSPVLHSSGSPTQKPDSPRR